MRVATVPTVYGIETAHEVAEKKAKMLFVATVPTVYGIETNLTPFSASPFVNVATVPTVYGIETKRSI